MDMALSCQGATSDGTVEEMKFLLLLVFALLHIVDYIAKYVSMLYLTVWEFLFGPKQLVIQDHLSWSI